MNNILRKRNSNTTKRSSIEKKEMEITIHETLFSPVQHTLHNMILTTTKTTKQQSMQ